ncbi:MAG TPA: hypothetical protein GXX28_02270 [Firmicutes bacterium]|nr:hypothetical protein [Bacillota bacterium]
MRRGKRVLLVAHCVLNQNAVVSPLARAPGALVPAIKPALEAGIGLLQLPCSEKACGGLSRASSMTREEYDTVEYRRLCARLARRVADDLEPLLADGCRVVGVLGIDGSPSCSVEEPQGILREELFKLDQLRPAPRLGIPDGCCGVGEGSRPRSGPDAIPTGYPEFWRRLTSMLAAGVEVDQAQGANDTTPR